MRGCGDVQYIVGSMPVFWLPSLPREWERRAARLPCPFESAGAVNFDFGQWFARIVFPCNFLDSFDAMFEDLILASNISSIISPILFQVFLH